MNTLDDLYNVIGFGEMSAQKVVTRLRDEYLNGNDKEELAKQEARRNPKGRANRLRKWHSVKYENCL